MNATEAVEAKYAMERIEALGHEYDRRSKLFGDFVGAFKKSGPDKFPSLHFEETDEPDVVTFRYLGRKLRIRHSFAVEECSEAFGTAGLRPGDVPSGPKKPATIASRVRSKLVLVAAKYDLDKEEEEEPLAGPLYIDSEGHLTSTERTAIVEEPEHAFRELLALWLGQRKPTERDESATNQHTERLAD